MQTLAAPREVVLEQLERMLASGTFAGAERSRALLTFLVEHALENRSDRLKEYTIGSEALGRGDSFDPRIDPIVRAEASRLRTRLERYYSTTGASDTVLISLPKGSYVPQVQMRGVPEAAPVSATVASAPPASGRFRRFIWFGLGGLTVGAAVILLISMTTPKAPPVEVGGVIELGGSDYSPVAPFGNDVILSPDGARIVFVALGSDHVSRLMMMKLRDQRTIVRLAGTEGAQAPFFHPDSRSVGFWANAKLKMVSVDGGSAPLTLAEAENFGGAAWMKDNDIIACIGGTVMRVSLAGTSTKIADLSEDGLEAWWPHLLPGDTHVLFTAVGQRGPDASHIEVVSVSDGSRIALKLRAGFARYLKDDYLLYSNQGTLFAVPFNRKELTVTGTGVPVLDDRVAYSTIFGYAKFDITPHGTLIYRRNPPLVASWLGPRGKSEPLLTKPGGYLFPRLSWDGNYLAINITDGGVIRTEIYDTRRPTEPIPLPFTPGSMSTAWHPDGFLVLGTRAGMLSMKVGETSKPETLLASPNVQLPWSFTNDGKRLAYMEGSPSLDLWTVPVNHSNGRLKAETPEPFLRTPYMETAPSFSPDRRWLVYGRGTGPSSKWDVYVQPFPRDPSKERKVSHEGGRIARWLSNGRELVYRTDDHRLMVVSYEVKNGNFIPGKPVDWTTDRLGDTGVISNFDVFENRVLGLVPASREEAERARTQVTVIPRFLDVVRARFAEGRK